MAFPSNVIAFPFLDIYKICRNQHLQWLTDSMWKQCQYISNELEPFSLLCKSLLSNESQWKAFQSSKDVYFLMSTSFSSENSSWDESKKVFSVLVQLNCMYVYIYYQLIKVVHYIIKKLKGRT